MLRPLRHYADFAGRSRAAEFWRFQVGQVMVVAVAYIAFAALIGFEQGPGTGRPVLAFQILMSVILAFVLGTLVPLIAVQVRRLHDQAMSGWFLLLFLVPYLGTVIFLVLMCRPGTIGPNRFGPDPRAEPS